MKLKAAVGQKLYHPPSETPALSSGDLRAIEFPNGDSRRYVLVKCQDAGYDVLNKAIDAAERHTDIARWIMRDSNAKAPGDS